MEKIKVCESCGAVSDFKLVNKKIICMGCGQLMIKDTKPVFAPVEAVAPVEAIVEMPLMLEEMRGNTENAQKEFEALEVKIGDVRQQKVNALQDGNTVKVVLLSKQDSEMQQALDAAYKLWQTCRKNYEYALSEAENRIIAESLLAEYSKATDARAAKGNILFNRLVGLNENIALISELTSEFQATQLKGMTESARLVSELKRLSISKIGDADILALRDDNYGNIRDVRASLSREIGLLVNNITLMEEIINSVHKSCHFGLLIQG